MHLERAVGLGEVGPAEEQVPCTKDRRLVLQRLDAPVLAESLNQVRHKAWQTWCVWRMAASIIALDMTKFLS